jgi:hypothetical protein
MMPEKDINCYDPGTLLETNYIDRLLYRMAVIKCPTSGRDFKEISS